MPDTELSEPPGTIIGGKYEIVSTLGIGGSGTVYKAHQIGKSRGVAVKVMHAGHPEGDSEKLRFAREAEVVKKLQHPHIVGLIDFGHHEHDVPYLVQPLLEGETLEGKLAREGAQSWDSTGRLSVHVLRALEKAHGMNIAHRDIKPPNIFVSRGVLGDVAQVLDFGLAKIVRSDADGALAVTRVGAVLGTPRYMAPEQARGEEVGQSADIYSFGLVMSEMLIGTPLIGGKNDVEIYAMQGSDRPLRLPAAILQSPFASVIQRAVAKPLDVRYRLASQMLADVRAIVEKLGGDAVGPGEADMDATHMLDPAMAVALSTPNQTSEKLRDAFNVIAKKRAAAEAREGRVEISPLSEPTKPFPLGAPAAPIVRQPAPSQPMLPHAIAPQQPMAPQPVAPTLPDPQPAMAQPAAFAHAPAMAPLRSSSGASPAPRPAKSLRGVKIALAIVLILLGGAVAALVFLLTARGS